MARTHAHADRGVNCQRNEWSRNVFQSRRGAPTGLSSFHNNADIYAPVGLKRGTLETEAPHLCLAASLS